MRDLEREVDTLREELRDLAEVVQQLAGERRGPARSTGSRALDMVRHGDEPIARVAEELINAVRASGSDGILSTSGYYRDAEGHGEALWVDERRTSDELFGQDDERVARVLSALGHRQRLAILKELLKQPVSATDLVGRLGMGTTGQVYHHLNALQVADLISQSERGQYRIKGSQIPALMVLLAGVHDLLRDTSYLEPPSEEDRQPS